MWLLQYIRAKTSALFILNNQIFIQRAFCGRGKMRRTTQLTFRKQGAGGKFIEETLSGFWQPFALGTLIAVLQDDYCQPVFRIRIRLDPYSIWAWIRIQMSKNRFSNTKFTIMTLFLIL
jgi:hypothetical protein